MTTFYSVLQAGFVITVSVALVWFSDSIYNAVERFVSFVTRNAPSRRMRNIYKAVREIAQSYSETFESFTSSKEREDFLFYSGLANPCDAWSVTSHYVQYAYDMNSIPQENRDIIPLFTNKVSIKELLSLQAPVSA